MKKTKPLKQSSKKKSLKPQLDDAEVTQEQDEIANLWGDPHHPDERAIEPVTATIKQDLNWLTKKAQRGDQIAYERLVSLVSHGATAVRALTTLAFEMTKQIAMNSTCWPVNITNSSDFPEDLDTLRQRLQIGANQPLGFNLQVRLNYKAKTKCREVIIYCLLMLQAARAFECKKRETIRFVLFTRKLDAQLDGSELSNEERKDIATDAHACRALANALHREIEPLGKTVGKHIASLRKLLKIGILSDSQKTRLYKGLDNAIHLPDLSPESHPKWFPPIKEILLTITKDAPESNGVLKEIGKYRADAYFRREHDVSGALQAKAKATKTGSAAKTIASDIRDGIFTRVKTQLSTLVKKEKP